MAVWSRPLEKMALPASSVWNTNRSWCNNTFMRHAGPQGCSGMLRKTTLLCKTQRLACRSFMGFQLCSRDITMCAAVRLSPRPPTAVVSQTRDTPET